MQSPSERDGSKFWGCSNYPACKWSDDKLPPPLPKDLPRKVDRLPQDFLDWVHGNHPQLFDAYDCETWNDLYWHVDAVRNDGHPNAALQAVVQEAENRGLLVKLAQMK